MVLSQVLCVALGYGVALQNPEVDPAAWERAKTFVAAVNRNLTPGFERLRLSIDAAKVSTGPGNEGWSFIIYERPQISITVVQNRLGVWEVQGSSSSANQTDGRPSRLPDRPANMPGRAIDPSRHLAIVRELFVAAGYQGQFEIMDTIDRDDMRLKFYVHRVTKGVPGSQPGDLTIDYESGQLLDFTGWDTTPPTERPDYRLTRDDAERVILDELSRRGIAGRLMTLTINPFAQHLRHTQSTYEKPWQFVELNATPEELQASRERRERFVYVAFGYNGLQGSMADRSLGNEMFEASIDPQIGRIIYFDLSRPGLGGPGGPKATPFPLTGEYRLIRAKRSGTAKGSLATVEAPAAFQGVDFFLKQDTRITQAAYAKDTQLLRIEGKFYRPDPALRQAIENILR